MLYKSTQSKRLRKLLFDGRNSISGRAHFITQKTKFQQAAILTTTFLIFEKKAAAISDAAFGAIDPTNPIIEKVLQPLTLTISAAVGVVIVMSLIMSGIQYSSARDNPQMVAAAKNRIVMSLLALVLFTFGFAILNWLVPGGVVF